MASIAKLPPQNIEAEQSLLGSLLIDKEAIIKVAEILSPADFYRSETHGKIYEAILELFEKREPVDLVTVTDKLRQNKSLDLVGGSAYLTVLVNTVPTSAHIESYARIIKENATRRGLIGTNTNLVEKAYDPGVPLENLIDEAEQSVFALSQKRIRKDFISIKDLLTISFDRLDELQKTAGKLRGVPTGFRDLDNKLAGLQDSNLIIFAARPGQGKCLAYDSKIINPQTGEVGTIEEYFKKKIKPILTLDQRLRISQTEVSEFVDDGIKMVYQVKTSMGKEIEVTLTHPFLTASGWKKLESIKEGEYIATPRILPYFGNSNLEDHKIILIAYLLSDSIFQSVNPYLVDDYIDSIKSFSESISTTWFTVKLSSSQNTADKRDREVPTTYGRFLVDESGQFIQYDQELDASLDINAFNSQEVITNWLRQINILDENIEERRIPAAIFKLPKEKISLFINRLFALDGEFIFSGNKTKISYSSFSKEVIYALEHLLLRFGIISSITELKTNLNEKDLCSFKLEIQDPLSLLIFCQEIGSLGKENEIQKIKKNLRMRVSKGKIEEERLPQTLFNYIQNAYDLKISSKDFNRSYLISQAKKLRSDELWILGSSDILWDQIVSIKPVGKKQVYDLSIQETHNFVANDFFVHNTSFVLNVAEHVAVKVGLPVGIFSLEMSQEELVDRLLVSQAEIDSWKLKTGKLDEKDLDRLSHAMGQLAEAPLFIDDTPGMSMAEIRTKARRLQMEHGLKLIIVDYLQLIHGRNLDNRVQEVSEISQSLKNLARELKVPVLALSQLSRAVENRGTRKPQLADLRESGAIEQDADVVMFIYREDAENLADVTLDIQKHRNGPTGEIKLMFVPERVKFYGMEKNRSAPAVKKNDDLAAAA